MPRAELDDFLPWAKENTAPPGSQLPLTPQAPLALEFPPPPVPATALLLGSGQFCPPVCRAKQVNRNQATVLINISRDSAGMGASGIELPQGRKKKGKKKIQCAPCFPVRNKIKVSDRCCQGWEHLLESLMASSTCSNSHSLSTLPF